MEGGISAPEAPPAQQPEVTTTKLDPRERQLLELRNVSHTVLDSKGKEIKKELASKSPEEQKQILEADVGKTHINILYDLGRARIGDYKIPESPNGMDFTKGNPAFVKIDGQPRKLLYIEAADEKNFTCRLEGLDETQVIPRDVVYDGQLLSEKDSVLTAFQGKEKELLETYIKSLSGEQIPVEYAQKLIEEQRTTPSEDELIAKHIETIKQEIDGLKKESQDTKKQEQLLAKLRLGQTTNGQLGIVFKIQAIKSLKEAGYSDIPEITKQQETKYQNAQNGILDMLKQANVSKEELQRIQEGFGKGDPNIVINEIVISKIKGLDTDRLEHLIFDKKMTEEEMLSMLSPDEKTKALLEKTKKLGKGFLLILLIALFGVGADFGKSVTQPQ